MYRTTKDIFVKQLHAYTITHAIEDRNVLQFHIEYFKGEGSYKPKPGEAIAQKAVEEQQKIADCLSSLNELVRG